MARRRDLVIAIIIGLGLILGFVLLAIVTVGLFGENDGMSFSGGDIGLVEVSGTIDEASGREWIHQLDKWQNNGAIKAVVVHVNSPGGEVAISQELYSAIQRCKAEKPVVISMAGVAASGGYYIACAADKIVANPSTITGSIGVIFQFHTFKDLMGKVGIGTETVKSGELKDVGSYSREMTENEELMLRSVVMDTYEQFVEVVAESRGMDKDAVYPLADGSIFTGLQAYNLGLVDTLGGLKEAVDLAGSLGHIEGEPKLVIPPKREPVNVFDLLGGAVKTFTKSVESNTSGPRLLFLYQ